MVPSALVSDEFNKAFLASAEHLRKLYAIDMSRLSLSGVRLKRGDRSSLRIQPVDLLKARRKNWDGDVDADTPPVKDTSFLDSWLARDHKRLVVIAPFGAGKSVFLAEIACELADRILRARGKLDERTLLPAPVRLRDWVGKSHLRFEDILIESAKDTLGLGLPGHLSLPDFQSLLSERRVLLILDGFDEVPDVVETRESGRRALRRELLIALDSLSPDQLVMASRPGYGAEDHFEIDERWTLRELSREEIKDVLARRFQLSDRQRSRLWLDQPDGDPRIRAFQSMDGSLKDWLARPLFMAAWCEHVDQLPDSPPQSLSDLMNIVFRHSLSRVNRDRG